LHKVNQAQNWQEREGYLAAAYETLAGLHNALGLTEPLPTEVSNFHGRPFKVIQGWRFAQAVAAQISDPALRRLSAETCIGGVDQWSDNTDLLENARLRPALRGLYDEGGA
jgi:hypothetical protein